MTIQKLVAGSAGEVGVSKGADVAAAVNLLIDGASGGSGVKSVKAYDYYDVTIVTNYGDTAYGFRDANTAQILAVNTITGDVSSFGAALPETGVRNIKFVTSSIILCDADGGTGIFKLYRSSNGGGTWSAVITPAIQHVRTLSDRSICVATISGQTVLLYGEYNVNASRVAGGSNDAVKLLRSDDLGATWSEVTRWNADGSTRNVRHIHCVKQGTDGSIYIATGDSNSESAIFKWDGSTFWPINTSPASLTQSSGLLCVYGLQRFRAVDINFRGEYLYWMPDTNSGSAGYASEAGIWKMKNTLTELERISTVNFQLSGHAGWLTADDEDGSMLWITGVDTPVVGFLYSAVIKSNPQLNKWCIVGAMRSQASGNVTPLGFFKNSQGKFFLSISNASGKASNNTSVFSSTALDFAGNFPSKNIPDTIHPVYWCSAEGSNSNNGYKPSSAFQTLDYALTGDRVTYGADVYIGAGKTTYNGAAISPKFNANARSGDSTESCYISGDGATKSSFYIDSSATATIAFSLLVNGNAANLGFKDITVYTDKNIRIADVLGSANTISAVRSIIGDCNFINPSLIRVEAGFLKSYSSIFYVSGSGITSPNSGTASTNLELYQSVISGGTDQIKLTTTGTSSQLVLSDVVMTGFTGNAIDTTAGFGSFSCVDCSFFSSATAAEALSGATTTWNGKINSAKYSTQLGVSAAFDSGSKRSADYGFDIHDYVK